MDNPKGWKAVGNGKEEPLYSRDTAGGQQNIFVDADGRYSCWVQGYAAPVCDSYELQDCLDASEHYTTVDTLRVGNYKIQEFCDQIQAWLAFAFTGMFDKSDVSIQSALTYVDYIEVLMAALRIRLLDQAQTETLASRGGEIGSKMQMAVFALYAFLERGEIDEVYYYGSQINDMLDEVRRDVEEISVPVAKSDVN